MELHILGPAFGLPSIDAECIAAVALVKSYCRASAQPWELVASHEPVSGTQLPYLQDGSHLYSGFAGIARHLADISGGSIPGLAADLDPRQQADSTALATFISAEGQLLLDISLYVSFENYRLRTRTAFTKLLPWYANFIIPPRRRAEARERTVHLGVSSVDVDDVHEDMIERPQNLQSSQKPFEHETEKHARKLLGRRDTVRSMLSRPEHAAAFRLTALADNFFEPLQDRLGNKSHLLGTSQPSIVDCLAFGYLSLMFYPKMPQSWLTTTMRSKYQKLVVYLGSLRDGFRIDAHPDEALDTSTQPRDGDAELPWVSPQSLSPVAVAGYIAHGVFEQLPLPQTGSRIESLQTKTQPGLIRRYMPGLIGLASTSLALLGYWAYNNVSWPHGDAVQIFGRRRFTDYGAAGAALSALGGLGYQARNEASWQQQQQNQAPAQIDVTLGEQVSS